MHILLRQTLKNRSTAKHALLGLMLLALTSLNIQCLFAFSYQTPTNSDRIQIEIISDNRGQLPISVLRNFAGHLTGSISVRQSERYRIRLSNQSSQRLAFVVAVDGLNVITGKSSWGNSNEGMYVLEADSKMVLSGWRTSRETEHRFYFTRSSDSYTQRRGYSHDIGTIKVWVYAEQFAKPGKPTGLSDFSPMSKRCPPRNQLLESPGTGYGQGIHSEVEETTFRAAVSPVRRVSIHYHWQRYLPRYKRDGFAPPPNGY